MPSREVKLVMCLFIGMKHDDAKRIKVRVINRQSTEGRIHLSNAFDQREFDPFGSCLLRVTEYHGFPCGELTSVSTLF